MTAYYNEKKDGSDYSTINVTNWQDVNITLDFKEASIKEDDNFYYLFAYPSKVIGVSKYGAEKDWKMPEELTLIKFAKKSYQKKDWKTKETVTVEPTEIEKLLCSIFDDLDKDKVYTGSCWITNSGQVEQINTGLSPRGDKVPEDILESLKEFQWSAKEVEEPKHIKTDSLSIPKSYSSYGSKSYGQKESEVLKDRLDFLIQQIKAAIPDAEINSIDDLRQLLVHEKHSSIATSIFELSIQLIK
jgi:hypothetical protein